MLEPYLAAEPPSGELQPRQRIDRDRIRREDRRDVADELIRGIVHEQDLGAFAQPGDVGPIDPPVDAEAGSGQMCMSAGKGVGGDSSGAANGGAPFLIRDDDRARRRRRANSPAPPTKTARADRNSSVGSLPVSRRGRREIMATSNATTPDEMIAALPPDRRDAIAKVRDVVRANLPPGYEEGMQFGMIGWYVPLERFPNTVQQATARTCRARKPEELHVAVSEHRLRRP